MICRRLQYFVVSAVRLKNFFDIWKVIRFSLFDITYL